MFNLSPKNYHISMQDLGSVSKPSYIAPRALIAWLKLLQAVAPKLALKKALTFFFSPIKFPTPEREEAFKHSCIISREEVNNKRITVYHIDQGVEKILLVHGWSGRATQFYKIAPAMAKAGYKVFAFTAPAHGSSPDKQTHMLEFADCIKYLDKKYGPFKAIIAHSIGGAATLNAIDQGVKTEKVVLLGVPGYIKDVVLDFCKRLRLNNKIANLIIQDLKETYDEDYEKFSTTRLAENMSIPGLIIHDTEDLDVDVAFARENHRVWKGSEYMETNGLGHRLILADEQVIDRIKDFIA